MARESATSRVDGLSAGHDCANDFGREIGQTHEHRQIIAPDAEPQGHGVDTVITARKQHIARGNRPSQKGPQDRASGIKGSIAALLSSAARRKGRPRAARTAIVAAAEAALATARASPISFVFSGLNAMHIKCMLWFESWLLSQQLSN